MSVENRLFPPMWDFAFKNIFGQAGQSERIFIDFVNSVFADKNEHLVKDVIFENTEITKDTLNGKAARLDVKALLDDETYINVEVQIQGQKSFEKRTLFHWAKLYDGQLERGDDFFKLKKSICINILDFKAIDNPRFHNIYGITNLEDHERFLTDLEFHFLEIPKWKEKNYDKMTKLEKWLLFLKAPNEKMLEDLSMQEPIINEAYQKLRYVSQDAAARTRYEAELKYELDFNTAVKASKIEGEMEGMLKVAKKMKSAGRSLSEIIEFTGLSKEDISSL